ncbi:MAG: hypothetical protein BRC38_17640 [Cyanobacteria bacterium QH_6_48_35]|nr:MAG: hypothetical protein BRC38_17640 [Cyanobacteria bacterium QH_6_48_35]
MAVAYSKDLGERALRWMASGRSISQVSRLLDVSCPTLYKWRNQVEQTAKVEAQPPRPPIPHQKIEDWQAFRELVAPHGELTTSKIAPKWGNISRHTIGRGLRKMGYTRKKKRTTTSNEIKKPGLNSWKNSHYTSQSN